VRNLNALEEGRLTRFHGSAVLVEQRSFKYVFF
jgi:hypothetical protein